MIANRLISIRNVIGDSQSAPLYRLMMRFNKKGSLEHKKKAFEEAKKILITKEIDVNARDQITNSTLLHAAVFFGWDDLAELLLNLGANPLVQDPNLLTPLHIACAAKHTPLIWSFVEKFNININLIGHEEQFTPLMCYVQSGPSESPENEMLLWFLQKGANIDAQCRNGCTALVYAIESKYLSAAQILIENGACVNGRDKKRGWTPLHFAVKNANEDDFIIDLLIRAGANARVKDFEGKTPIDIAEPKIAEKLVALSHPPVTEERVMELIQVAIRPLQEEIKILKAENSKLMELCGYKNSSILSGSSSLLQNPTTATPPPKTINFNQTNRSNSILPDFDFNQFTNTINMNPNLITSNNNNNSNTNNILNPLTPTTTLNLSPPNTNISLLTPNTNSISISTSNSNPNPNPNSNTNTNSNLNPIKEINLKNDINSILKPTSVNSNVDTTAKSEFTTITLISNTLIDQSKSINNTNNTNKTTNLLDL
eukprot:TRINITY_DN1688_c1_g1_i1.p1 TRINITY_DN1688_c1_g1~~TRINITY_DN1688_c1_g1_i1.p1  ORF type:complete len:485 (-),score=204.05 TRINITY_DN1688_c1_g1_i1:1-1455(-)